MKNFDCLILFLFVRTLPNIEIRAKVIDEKLHRKRVAK